MNIDNNNNNIDFSVLICVYKKDDARIFDYALDSIFKNTLQPKKVVLVVDGFIEDNLENVIKKYSHITYFKIIRNVDNIGFVNSLNLGLKNIVSKWVVRCDADDFNVPERFKILSNHMKEDVDLIGSYVAETNELNEIYAVKKVPLSHQEILKHLKKRNPFNHMSVAYKRSVVVNLKGYPNIELREDYALWATMISEGYKSKNIKDILVHASAGEKMFKRRKGGAIIKAEIALQSHLINTQITTYIEALIYGTIRSLSFMMPTFIVRFIYNNFLRN